MQTDPFMLQHKKLCCNLESNISDVHKHEMQTQTFMLQHKHLCCNPESNINDNIKIHFNMDLNNDVFSNMDLNVDLSADILFKHVLKEAHRYSQILDPLLPDEPLVATTGIFMIDPAGMISTHHLPAPLLGGQMFCYWCDCFCGVEIHHMCQRSLIVQ